MTQTYDGATTALRRWSKRWKALASREREWLALADQHNQLLQRHLYVAARHAKRWKALAKKLRFSVRLLRGQVFDLELLLSSTRTDRANLQFRLDLVTADPDSLASSLLSKHNALRMASKNLDAQRQRIEELTAELERYQQKAQHIADAFAAERAAREQAENEHEETLRELDVRGQQLDGAVAAAADLKHERDTALARVKELELLLTATESQMLELRDVSLIQHKSKTDCKYRCVAAETALASARELIANWVRNFNLSTACRAGVRDEYEESKDWLSSHPSPAPVAVTFVQPGKRTTTAEDLDAVWQDESDAVPEDGSAVGPLQLRTRAQIDEHIASEIRAWRKAVAEGTRHPMTLNYITLERLQELCDEPESAPVAAPCAGCEKLTLHVTMLEGEFETCHRQHEQCMNLLARVSLQLPPGDMRDLVREMLSKGELPEGTAL